MMHSLNWQRIACDHCGKQGPQSGSAMETRVMAYRDGWRFPPKTKTNGQPSARSLDLCPECAQNGTEQPLGATNAPSRVSPVVREGEGL